MQTRFPEIIVDETTDDTNFSQLFAAVRFLYINGDLQEIFFSFVNVTKHRTTEIFPIAYSIYCSVRQAILGSMQIKWNLKTVLIKRQITLKNCWNSVVNRSFSKKKRILRIDHVAVIETCYC